MIAVKPQFAYRAAIHNQIYNTCYYHVSKYIPGKSAGSWIYDSSWGYRGKGGNLGMGAGEAIEKAAAANKEAGWDADTPERPSWM